MTYFLLVWLAQSVGLTSDAFSTRQECDEMRAALNLQPDVLMISPCQPVLLVNR